MDPFSLTLAASVTASSRLFHIGPGLGIAHQRCVNAIAELLTIPSARVT